MLGLEKKTATNMMRPLVQCCKPQKKRPIQSFNHQEDGKIIITKRTETRGTVKIKIKTKEKVCTAVHMTYVHTHTFKQYLYFPSFSFFLVMFCFCLLLSISNETVVREEIRK